MTKNNSWVISTLDDLEKCGRVFLYCCIHLLLNNGKKNTYKTFLFLENNENINVDKHEVLSVLSDFVDSNGCLFSWKKKKILASINDHIESNNKKQQKENCLTYAKYQCGKHDIPQMARWMDIPWQTFKSRIWTYEEKFGKIDT